MAVVHLQVLIHYKEEKTTTRMTIHQIYHMFEKPEIFSEFWPRMIWWVTGSPV